MQQFDCVVDTTPMAQSIDRVTGRLADTKAAVITMQTAVIAAEQKASDDICNNIDRGFFNMINSQFSAKKVENYVEMYSKMSLLMQLSKSLISLHDRMEADFYRLRREYQKVFQGLDKALENRIRELDCDALHLSDVRNQLILSKMKREIPPVLPDKNESQSCAQAAVTAHMNKKTVRAIDALMTNYDENVNYKEQLSSFVNPVKISEEMQECVPVVVAKSHSIAISNSEVSNVYIPEELDPEAQNQIRATVSMLEEANFKFDKKEDENKAIAREYWKMLNESGLDQRKLNIMAQLFKNGGQ